MVFKLNPSGVVIYCMFKKEINMSNVMKPGDVAKLFNVSVRTIQNWDINGILPASYYPTGRRYYSADAVYALLSKGSNNVGDE